MTMTAVAMERSLSPSSRKPSTETNFFLEYPEDEDQSDPPSLSCLTNEDSSFAEVSRMCLQLNQACNRTNTVLHDSAVAQYWSEAWKALRQCLQYHKSRQCRVVAATTAGLTARSVYARIRPVIQLYSQREPTPSRVEDEVLDVGLGLVNAALAEEDDGVAVAMIGALGHLVLTSNTSFGAMLEDELTLHVSNLLQIVPSPYAPSMRSVADEDPAVPTTELQVRVLEHAMLSKLWQLVQRCIIWGNAGASAWPVITQALIYACQLRHSVADRTTYATRWNQVEYTGLKSTFWEYVLRPSLEHMLSGFPAYTASLCALRLECHSPLIPACLREEVSAAFDPERKRALTAVLFVALRPVPISQRTRTLLWLADQMDTDLAFWTEFVISFQLDGPNDDTRREDCWNLVLHSPLLRQQLQTYPMVNYAVLAATIGTRTHASDWLALAQVVLGCDALQLGDDDLLWETALELWQDYLVVIGAMTPSTSVALNVSVPTRRLAARAAEWKKRPPPPRSLGQNSPVLSLASWLPKAPDRWVRHVWAMVVDQGAVAAATEFAMRPCLTAVAGWQSLGMVGAARRDKAVVGLAVSNLQGKKSRNQQEATKWKSLRSHCESAVARIQAVYENPQRTVPMDFPGAETMFSSLIDEPETNEEIVAAELERENFRQIVANRLQWIPQFLQHDYLRLKVPPVHESLDGRLYGYRAATALTGWGHTVLDCAAPSDPGQILLAYIPTRTPSCDGSLLFSIQVVMRVYNITAFTMTDGLRLEVGLQRAPNWNKGDVYGHEARKLLETEPEIPLFSASSTFREELKSGEFVTWTIDLGDVEYSHSYRLVPSVVYLNIPVEKETSRWVGTRKNGDNSTAGGESKSGEDDFRVTTIADHQEEGFEDLRLVGRPLELPALIFFQPDSLVFRNRCGDIECFLSLWSVLPYELPTISVVEASPDSTEKVNPVTQKIARMCSLEVNSDSIPGLKANRLWAFCNLSGKRSFAIMFRKDNRQLVQLRSNDKQALLSLVGSKSSRQSTIRSLLPDMQCES